MITLFPLLKPYTPCYLLEMSLKNVNLIKTYPGYPRMPHREMSVSKCALIAELRGQKKCKIQKNQFMSMSLINLSKHKYFNQLR